jgi:hypothetical protein
MVKLAAKANAHDVNDDFIHGLTKGLPPAINYVPADKLLAAYSARRFLPRVKRYDAEMVLKATLEEEYLSTERVLHQDDIPRIMVTSKGTFFIEKLFFVRIGMYSDFLSKYKPFMQSVSGALAAAIVATLYKLALEIGKYAGMHTGK